MAVVYDPAGLPPEWPEAAAVVPIDRVREAGGPRTRSAHFYLTSHRGTAAELADQVRGHWAIEAMHWVLDVALREDESRTRAGYAGANLGMIRRVAVSILKRADAKGGIHTRRLMAAWDDDFMLKVVQGIPTISMRLPWAGSQPASHRLEVAQDGLDRRPQIGQGVEQVVARRPPSEGLPEPFDRVQLRAKLGSR